MTEGIPPQSPLQGRTALVTGASRGIGRAIAERLAELGARLVLSGRSEATLLPVAESLAAGPEHGVLAMDVADGAAIERGLSQLAERFGHVDILINNAGIAESKPYHRSDDEMFSRMMAVNALAVMRLCRALLPPMVARGWGRSVIVASNAGLSGYAYSSAYCASKHAVLGLMRAIALEIARSEVTINAVCPGWVDTDMAKEAVDRIADKTSKSSADARKALERMSPQGRMVQPAEVASLVAYLCMQQARSVHGQALVMDGGAMMR